MRTAISSDAIARASRSASWSDSKARMGPPGRRSSAVSMIAGMPRKSSLPLRKAWTATSLAALRTHGAVPPAAAASRARRRHGKASLSTGSKVSAPISARSSGAHGDVDALGVVQRVGDRHAHVRVAEVREGGAVAQQDVGVHDRLRVYDDVDPLVRRAEEVMGLDQLEALVHQRGRVDRDLAAHRPRGVLEGLLDAHALEVGAAAAAERAAAGGEHELVDRSRPLGGDELMQGRVLGVHGDDLRPGGLRELDHELAARRRATPCWPARDRCPRRAWPPSGRGRPSRPAR